MATATEETPAQGGVSKANELEASSAYLGRHNFKVLVEYLTAEVILNRPKDPVAFLRDVLDEKVQAREGKPYSPADCVQYAKDCYKEASASADEDGEIHPRKAPRRPGTLSDTIAIKKRLEILEQAIASSRAIAGQLDPYDATEVIIKETCELLHCDRASLFTLDEGSRELQLMVAKGAKSIRLPIGQGVAGSVAATGVRCNIADAYDDSRFNSEHDANTGYRTKSILAVPVQDADSKVIGVLQAINRFPESTKQYQAGLENYEDEAKDGTGKDEKYVPFSDVDEEMVGILAAQAGIALNNASLYQNMASSQRKVQSLLDIIQAMHSNLGVNSLLFTITQRAHELVEADRCTMFLLDKTAKELMSLQGEVNLRMPMDKGIAGECCINNEIINIPDAYEDPRFNQEVDKKSGFKTKTILCMPCQDNDGTVVGVIQLINKLYGDFNEDDVSVMRSFLMIAGPVLAQSQLYQAHAQDASTEFAGKTIARGPSSKIQHQELIEEGEEGEGDE
ncbi:cGMP-specific 3',5'-cyclic phosphodiesterase [Hondaea fermentalgiana]|uniref:cGMP-specific 3',5'-cyclic phosphodiesterase n=1 Tax=Hondaea fermentalgiana TaxID=2315210 RepID=A0A2R5GEK1_9STRA|nr:cGMP-specific 3',5'-cyclic phosphodiesterase [Hondaea fermentalgiana]|eukprot:GBG28178.1 cGMP-specific 3',5'-cyclic phosphodiesterase [Hondaea fermentalgiana]